MTGIAALAIGAAFTSCSKEVEQLSQEELQQYEIQKIKSNYEQAFTKVFGVANNRDNWGFSDTNSTRGSAPNSNQWFDGTTPQFKHLVQPADVTAREEQVVSDWFKANQHPTCDPIQLTEFFVQQVYFGTKEYHSTDNNGYATSVIGGQHMDYLYAWDPAKNEKDHIFNFNTSNPPRTGVGLQNMQLMQNSSTECFGFHESYNTQSDRYYLTKNVNWVIKAIKVDGVWGYYVGFDYESHGDRGDYDPDGFFDDRIVKIVPGNGEYPWLPSTADLRVMAEDLSAGEDGDDFDFNDVVFDVYFSPNVGEAYVMVQAAGGTLPLRVNGTEVHGLFGKTAGTNGLYPMINTHAEDKGLPGESGLAAQKIQLTGITVNSKSEANQKIKVEVQKTITTADGVTSQQWIELENTGAAACKIGVDPNNNWANERENVNSVCTMNQWVSGGVLEPTHP